MNRFQTLFTIGASMLCASAAPSQEVSSANPTCPVSPNWAANQIMELTPLDRGDHRVLLAEGMITPGLANRLRDALDADDTISEIWLRSPGGDAYAGNEAGRMLRTSYPGIVTRIPAGWACFSACNFVFMGGQLRVVEPEGQFMVHMFTHTGNRDIVRQEVEGGTDSAIDFITDIEQSSAQLATEDNDFLIRMGVSRRLLREVMYATKAGGEGETRRCLTQDEAYDYNVANIRE